MLPRLARSNGFAWHGHELGRSLYWRLVAAGLVSVGMHGHLDLRQGSSPGARLDQANLSQVRDEALRNGLVTPEEIDRMLSLLGDPEFVLASPVMFSAWGQRPHAAASVSPGTTA